MARVPFENLTNRLNADPLKTPPKKQKVKTPLFELTNSSNEEEEGRQSPPNLKGIDPIKLKEALLAFGPVSNGHHRVSSFKSNFDQISNSAPSHPSSFAEMASHVTYTPPADPKQAQSISVTMSLPYKVSQKIITSSCQQYFINYGQNTIESLNPKCINLAAIFLENKSMGLDLRNKVLDYYAEVSLKFHNSPASSSIFFRASYIFDACVKTSEKLGGNKFEVYIFGLASLFLAFKVEENSKRLPDLSAFNDFSNGTFVSKQIELCEAYILKLLQFNMTFPTALDYLNVIMAQAFAQNMGFLMKIKSRSEQILKFTMLDPVFHHETEMMLLGLSAILIGLQELKASRELSDQSFQNIVFSF